MSKHRNRENEAKKAEGVIFRRIQTTDGRIIVVRC